MNSSSSEHQSTVVITTPPLSTTSSLTSKDHHQQDMLQVTSSLSNCNNLSSMSSSSNTSLKESKTNLIVNYLPQTLQLEELKALFETIGEIESCKLIRDKTSGQSLCYGFVNFVHIQDADRAVKQLNGSKVQNKIIKVSYARPSCESIKGANLYVCGLPKHWTVNDLNSYFSQCGKIITSRILFNQNGQTKGVGFIRFDQRTEADLAIEKLNGQLPYENAEEPITVKFANYPAAITNKMMAALPLAAAAAAAGFYATNKPAGSSQVMNPTPPQPQAIQTTIRTLPQTPPQLQQQQTATTSSNTTFTPLTAAYNSFAAAALNCLPNANEFLHTGITNHQNQQIPTLHTQLNANLSGNNLNLTTNTLTPIASGTGWCIFVYNLAPETEENILWQLFGPFGAVQNVKIVRDYQTQKCKGFGFVTMSNYEEAVMAINSLNGFTLGNRILQVSFKTNRNINMM